MIELISLGAGVQSSTMALMAAHGEIEPMPEAAIFADTGAEPRQVYDWLDWLEAKLPFPVHRVMHDRGLTVNIEESIGGENQVSNPPFYTEFGIGKLRRNCTIDYKLNPIRKKARELAGLVPKQRVKAPVVRQWIGISTDEIQRMRGSMDKWQELRYPLIEARMTRGHCLEWMEANGYTQPPRSACVYCPFKSNAEWQHTRNDPEAWSEAVRIDEMIRNGVRGTKQKLYLHRDGVPLVEADLTTAESAGQISWLDECEGMCGV